MAPSQRDPDDPGNGSAQSTEAGALKKFIEGMGALPSLPSLYLQLTEELRSPDVSAARISRIVSKDLAMTSKILQIVNSAYFGLSRQISNVERAILLMGLEMLRTFVLSVEVFAMFEPRRLAGLAVAGLWRHSMNCSALARRVASANGFSRDTGDQIATAAFLHDIGKLLMANERPDRYREVSELMKTEQIPACRAEQEVFGFTHAEVGGVLLRKWYLPETVVAAVRWHHSPHELAGDSLGPVTLIHITDYLEHEQSEELDSQFVELDTEHLSLLPYESLVDEWRALVSTEA